MVIFDNLTLPRLRDISFGSNFVIPLGNILPHVLWIGTPTLYQLSHPAIVFLPFLVGWFLPQRWWSEVFGLRLLTLP